ncbi:putative selenate ABC transporter substrate-binding protein [Hydrogenophaga sp.]|uniref:putative selenate ABC transporter substrate-binding protein n=1 Tax=Hydrogenophaga sp. TaxID=1904254 RepID=UPI00262A4917|nr:putative selenate ABC transporter substrate-binding protein [Hydrogenophaga sp.]MCW5653614.1 putative selenate ABC transporter substrate-binding protein [Hydrogenophaga sp.]
MNSILHRVARRARLLTAVAALSLCAGAHAQASFKVTTIPEEAASEQIRKFGPMVKYLERSLGTKVEFVPVSDYPAAVEALVNKQVDLVWFGGFTFVQAKLRSGDKVVPLVQREEDTQFRSVFITQKDSGIKTLADLKGKQVSFGSASSTSGHLMPRSFLLEAGIEPERDFKRVAFSGAHDATIASVVSGRVDAAALDITVWRKFVSENKVDTSKVDVFYTTPPYFNYNWSVHADMPAAQREKVTKALLALSTDNPEGKEVLGLARATRYVPTKPENYKGLEAAGRSAGLIK